MKAKLQAAVKAAKLKQDLTQLKMASVGHTPQGFGFGRALDIDMLNTFGVTLDSIEARELIDQAKAYTDEDCEEYLKEMKGCTVGLEKTPDQNLKDFARLCKAYKDYVVNNNIGALSSRCWPDFFTAFGTPVCAVLAMLNDLGVAASCEADAYGALSMYMGMNLTGNAVFFGDPVSLDEEENTITYWHCGTAACSLAHPAEGAQIGVHPNRKIGPAMDFGCKPCEKVTDFRCGKKGRRKLPFLPVIRGGSGQTETVYRNVCRLKTKNASIDVVNQSVLDGWEPHFAVIYGDVKAELEILGHMLGIEICEY